MLNRKANKLANGASSRSRNGHPQKPRIRRRFIISAKAQARLDGRAEPAPVRNGHGQAKLHPAEQAKAAYASRHESNHPRVPGQPVDLTETIKTLVHLAHEHGHVTYDDI